MRTMTEQPYGSYGSTVKHMEIHGIKHPVDRLNYPNIVPFLSYIKPEIIRTIFPLRAGLLHRTTANTDFTHFFLKNVQRSSASLTIAQLLPMTRSISSRTLAILFVGAAISSGVLAAPTSFAGQGSLSVRQSPEFATLQRRGDDHANIGPRRDGVDLTFELSNQDGEHDKDVSGWPLFFLLALSRLNISLVHMFARYVAKLRQPTGSSRSLEA
ncbi:hypothetical protein FB446DRAFT_219164 [Lentinula raphanica]|nr:hypothetical protein FB446DRAFT_219164 [Lentinula raphanica]